MRVARIIYIKRKTGGIFCMALLFFIQLRKYWNIILYTEYNVLYVINFYNVAVNRINLHHFCLLLVRHVVGNVSFFFFVFVTLVL